MALTPSLRRMYEPVVDRAVKTGGWGTTTVKHDPGVMTDALFQKAQMELGIANLQADFGLKAAQIKADTLLKAADIQTRSDIALADLTAKSREFQIATQMESTQFAATHALELARFAYERSLNETSFIEQVASGAQGALLGGIAGKNMTGGKGGMVAGAILGGAAGFAGAKESRQAMHTTGSVLNTFAEASQVVAKQRKEREAKQAMTSSMERLSTLNGKINSSEAIRNPQLAQQFHAERNRALMDLYQSAIEGGMNPQQAASWVQYIDETSQGKDKERYEDGTLKPMARISDAFSRYQASDKTPKDEQQFIEEASRAWIEEQVKQGKPVPGGTIEAFIKASRGQGLEPGQLEELMDPMAAQRREQDGLQDEARQMELKERQEDREWKVKTREEDRAWELKKREEDRQLEREEQLDQSMGGGSRARGSSSARSSGKGGKPQKFSAQEELLMAMEEFESSDKGPEAEKRFRDTARKLFIAENFDDPKKLNASVVDQYIAGVRGGAPMPPARDVTPKEPVDEDVKPSRKEKKKPAPKVEMKKIAPGQEEIVPKAEEPVKKQAPPPEQEAPRRDLFSHLTGKGEKGTTPDGRPSVTVDKVAPIPPDIQKKFNQGAKHVFDSATDALATTLGIKREKVQEELAKGRTPEELKAIEAHKAGVNELRQRVNQNLEEAQKNGFANKTERQQAAAIKKAQSLIDRMEEEIEKMPEGPLKKKLMEWHRDGINLGAVGAIAGGVVGGVGGALAAGGLSAGMGAPVGAAAGAAKGAAIGGMIAGASGGAAGGAVAGGKVGGSMKPFGKDWIGEKVGLSKEELRALSRVEDIARDLNEAMWDASGADRQMTDATRQEFAKSLPQPGADLVENLDKSRALWELLEEESEGLAFATGGMDPKKRKVKRVRPGQIEVRSPF